jgi:6-phosphogluconolactonase
VEDFNGQYSGAVAAYSIDYTSLNLTFINQISSMGADPCHTYIDKSDAALYVSNYCSGTIEVVEINKSDGSLCEVKQLINHNSFQEEGCTTAKAHEVYFDGSHVYAVDLGLDRVFHYELNPNTHSLQSPLIGPAYLSLETGSGPRHMVTHPSLNVAFILSELVCSVSMVEYNHETGVLGIVISVVSMLADPSDNMDMAAAEIQISLDGKYVYTSARDLSNPNLGRSSITVFSIDFATNAPPRLTPIQWVSSMGVHPRHFTFDSEGIHLLVANKVSNNIVVFAVDKESGRLNPEGTVFTHEAILQPSHLVIVQ